MSSMRHFPHTCRVLLSPPVLPLPLPLSWSPIQRRLFAPPPPARPCSAYLLAYPPCYYAIARLTYLVPSSTSPLSLRGALGGQNRGN
ncbi:unnamed protein product [Periconia digitata]|uniref:Uncharacterized protein n=1 Tax=Periconia digitata TaxID=1303443 RepID=A0A9W4UMS2_9PLEO|nr:unnamed protein product [Periconia digitata]